MSLPPDVAKKRLRRRVQALWSFVIAGIGFIGVLVGILQYLYSGEVSIRPGVQPVSGQRALEFLAELFVVSAAFAGVGMFLRRRAAR